MGLVQGTLRWPRGARTTDDWLENYLTDIARDHGLSLENPGGFMKRGYRSFDVGLGVMCIGRSKAIERIEQFFRDVREPFEKLGIKCETSVIYLPP